MYYQEKSGIPILLWSISEDMNYHWRPVQVTIGTTQEFQVIITGYTLFTMTTRLVFFFVLTLLYSYPVHMSNLYGLLAQIDMGLLLWA